MSNLLLLRRTAGGAPQTGGGGGSPTTISAVLTQQATATTGTLRFTGGFPLPPTGPCALMPGEENKFSVWIGGVEQSIHAEALRGRHPNGALRAIRYDLDYTVGSTADVSCEVRIGTVRGTTDRSRRTITQSVMNARRWLLPTQASYKTGTWLTGMPLVPQSSWNATETAYFKTAFDVALSEFVAGGTYTGGAAAYNASRAIASAWCCQDGTSYLNHAIEWSSRLLTSYHCPIGTDNNYGGSSQINSVENLGRRVESSSEAYSQAEWDYAIAYLITGWGFFWSTLNHNAQRYYARLWNTALWTTGGEPFAWKPSTDNSPRKAVSELRWFLAGYGLDCSYAYGDVDNAGRQPAWSSELTYWRTAIDALAWDSSRGAYRAGYTGFHKDQLVFGDGAVAEFPTFQISVTGNIYIDHALNIAADSNIPARVRTNALVALANTGLLPSDHYFENNGTGTGKWANTYRASDVAVPTMVRDWQSGCADWTCGTNGTNDPFDFVMQARTRAYLAAWYPSETVYGATWATWRDRSIQPKQIGGLVHNSKFIGEHFNCFDLPAIRVNGVPASPSTIRTPTVHTAPPS